MQCLFAFLERRAWTAWADWSRTRTVHAIERSFRQLDDRMWSMEERAERKERNANRTDDGRIYIENATVIRR